MTFHAVVMAGGSGTRFWPLSRRERPKQVLPLTGSRPLLGDTLDRIDPLSASLWIACGQHLEAVIRDAIGDEFAVQFVLEPEPRNTAPCVGLAVGSILAETGDEETVVAFLPADHAIEPADRFRTVLEVAVAHARSQDRLVVFGIQPTSPATGYGYIEHGERLVETGGLAIDRVQRFCEKPDAATAAAWLAAGGYSWNGGFVVGRIRSYLAEFRRHQPASHDAVLEIREGCAHGDREKVNAAFRSMEQTSFDYAILEQSDGIDVIGADFAWDDLGSPAALARRVPADEDGNRTDLAGGLAAVLHDCRDTFVVGKGTHLLAGLGLQGLIVVHTEDATLICPQDRLEEVRKVVDQIRRNGREDML